MSRVDDMVASPNRHFSAPREVLADNALSFDDKRRILESWKLDAQRLAESTAENMTGGEETDLREVSKTLVELKAMTGDQKMVKPRRRRGAGMALSVATGAVVGAGAGLVLLSVTAAAPILTLSQTTLAGGLLGGLVRVFRKTAKV
jgi:hypothetical protein